MGTKKNGIWRVENGICLFVKRKIGGPTDDFAEKAENSGKLTWIAKSNSLRRSAKAKANEVQELAEEIASLKKKD